MKLIKDIPFPIYVINNIAYNEYEVREIQAQVTEGTIPFETVKDLTVTEVATGIIQRFRPNGMLYGDDDFEGFKLNNDAAIRVFLGRDRG